MVDGMRLAPQVRRKMNTPGKEASVRGAYWGGRPHPSDQVAEVIDADEQTLTGPDGTVLRYDRRRQMVTGVRFDGEDENEWG